MIEFVHRQRTRGNALNLYLASSREERESRAPTLLHSRFSPTNRLADSPDRAQTEETVKQRVPRYLRLTRSRTLEST